MIKNDKNDKTTKLEKKHGKNDINGQCRSYVIQCIDLIS